MGPVGRPGGVLVGVDAREDASSPGPVRVHGVELPESVPVALEDDAGALHFERHRCRQAPFHIHVLGIVGLDYAVSRRVPELDIVVAGEEVREGTGFIGQEHACPRTVHIDGVSVRIKVPTRCDIGDYEASKRLTRHGEGGASRVAHRHSEDPWVG